MADEVLELSWLLAKEDGADDHDDVSPYKAYFCLKWGGEIIDQREFTKAELKKEIDRLHKTGERPVEYEQALKELSSVG